MNGSQAEYVRGNKADQKVYADWDQEKWLAEHTLRRSTQKGLHVHTHVVLTSHCFYFILDNLAVVFGMRERDGRSPKHNSKASLLCVLL